MFEVIVLGVGDTFSERYNPTSLLLCCEGRYLAIDCPDSYRRVLRAAAERSGRALALEAIDDVLITHLHGDHVNGLEGVAYYKRFFQQRRLRLLCSQAVGEVIWEQRLVAAMSPLFDGQAFRPQRFEDYFEAQWLDPDAEQQVGPFAVSVRPTRHHIPTLAIRVRTSAGTLGYSCDTAFDPTLIEWLSVADLIIHETNLGPSHTPYAALAALPETLRAKMRLIHYPDRFDPRGDWAIAPLHEGDVLGIQHP